MPALCSVRVALAASLLALATALAACGGGDVRQQAPRQAPPGEGGAQLQPGSGGDELSADDTARVVDAKRVLEGGCTGLGTSGYSMSAGQAVASMVDVARRSGPSANFEYGGSEQRMTMGDVLRTESTRLKRCNPGAAAQLARAAG